MNMTPKTVFAIGAVVLIGAYLAKKQVAAAAQAVGAAVNPVSHSNIAYQGAEAVTQAIAPKSDISDIYDSIFGSTNYNPNP